MKHEMEKKLWKFMSFNEVQCEPHMLLCIQPFSIPVLARPDWEWISGVTSCEMWGFHSD